jgi:hypothetical protein
MISSRREITGFDTVAQFTPCTKARPKSSLHLAATFSRATPDTDFTAAPRCARCRLTAHVSTKIESIAFDNGRSCTDSSVSRPDGNRRQFHGTTVSSPTENSMGVVQILAWFASSPPSSQLLSEPQVVARLHERRSSIARRLTGEISQAITIDS